jgi:AAA15 family ATPase/GTPase
MLIQFSVTNYKTFKDKATLSMTASNSDKVTRENENVFTENRFNLRLLKSAVIYGANASGKSKLFNALGFMRNFSLESSKESQSVQWIGVDPFRLNTKAENEPSEFEIVFASEGILYRYGFEATQKEIISEWLYYKPKTKEVELFYREKQKIESHKLLKKADMLIKGQFVRHNALFLSVLDQWNEEIAKKVIRCFSGTRVISGLNDFPYKQYTSSKVKDDKYKQKYLDMLKAADIGIDGIKPMAVDKRSLPEEINPNIREILLNNMKEDDEIVFDIQTSHKRYDENKKQADSALFSLENDESDGTKKFFFLLGPIIDSLEKGYSLVIDELDSKLHPNLVYRIAELFNSSVTNPNNAQLIFNTQNTNLLSTKLLRRDQIWFTEKNKYGEAELYSLADFKTDEVRKNEAYEDNYIRGKYGAVPFLNGFENVSLKAGGKNEKE